MKVNGMKVNGMKVNEMKVNGMKVNGMKVNGMKMLEAPDSLLLWSILVQFLYNTNPNPLMVAFPPPVVVACSVLV